MLEVCSHRPLICHALSHLFFDIVAAEQHACLTYSGTAFEGAIEDASLVGQILRISYR